MDSGGEGQKSHGTVQQKDTQKQPNMVVCNGAPISLRPRRGRRRRRRRRRRTSLVCARQFAVAGQQQYNNSRITASLPPPSPVQSKKNKTHSLASPRLESGLVCGSLRTRPPFFLLFCFLPSFFFFQIIYFHFLRFSFSQQTNTTPQSTPQTHNVARVYYFLTCNENERTRLFFSSSMKREYNKRHSRRGAHTPPPPHGCRSGQCQWAVARGWKRKEEGLHHR